MERDMLKLKEEMMTAFSSEVDLWLSKEPNIKDGIEYEEVFMESAKRINKMLLEKSLGKVPASPNGKKNSTPVLAKCK